MDFNRNADKIADCAVGVSYGQVDDVDNALAVGAELFTVQQFKDEYGKIDTVEENNLIAALIIAARRMCEQYVGVNFIARSVTTTINNYNGGAYLPYGPIGAIASVTDIDGNTIVATGYKLLGNQFKKVLWPLQVLIFTYTGGYTTGNCPAELVNAVKAQTLFLFENRGDMTSFNMDPSSRLSISPMAAIILNPLKRV